MAVTEEQKKAMIEQYEKMMNESARELAKHRLPCGEKDKLQILARELGVVESEVVFPPDGASRPSNNLNGMNVEIPVVTEGTEKSKE